MHCCTDLLHLFLDTVPFFLQYVHLLVHFISVVPGGICGVRTNMFLHVRMGTVVIVTEFETCGHRVPVLMNVYPVFLEAMTALIRSLVAARAVCNSSRFLLISRRVPNTPST